MSENPTPDMTCVPYRRKGLYFVLTVPFVLIMLAVFIYLWRYSFLLSLAYLGFYFMTSFFQAYCCAYQDCPYVGKFCPAVIGIYPGNMFAKWLYSNKKIVRSKKKFEQSVTWALVGWGGLIILPLYWLSRLSIWWAVGYAAAHVVYTLIFWLTICPVCAIRNTCPGGKLYNMVAGRREQG
jgi:hypothetical protein